jgi:hypothetical protein
VAILVGSQDHRTQIWKGAIQGPFHQSLVAIAQWFLRRRLKCEMLTDDGRKVMTIAHLVFRPGELKKKVWSIAILQLWKYAIVRSRGRKYILNNKKHYLMTSIYWREVPFSSQSLHIKVPFFSQSLCIKVPFSEVAPCPFEILARTLLCIAGTKCRPNMGCY